MKLLDLFSGIGGFSLGLERSGVQTVGFCEVDPFCRRVLAKHWPGVPIHDDIRTRAHRSGEADIITAGFPCQGISQAGKRAGLADARSGLWREVVRAVRVVGPRWTLLENVAALLKRGMGTVLGDLAEIGHDAEWDCIPASIAGAPDIRDRIWILAEPQHPHTDRQRPHPAPLDEQRGPELRNKQVGEPGQVVSALAGAVAWLGSARRHGWAAEPGIRRVVDGLPGGLVKPRLIALGNAVKPVIPEAIGASLRSA